MKKFIISITSLSIFGMLGTFMPWAKGTFGIMGNKTILGSDGDGWITFILFFIILIFTIIKLKKEELSKIYYLGISAISSIIVIFSIYKIMTLNQITKNLGGEANEFLETMPEFININVGIGLYIVITIGIIINAITIYNFYLKIKKIKR